MTQRLTAEQVEEFTRCSQDPNYFIERYVKIISLDKGFVKIQLYPFQKDAINKMNNNRKIIVKAGRQVGKTTMVVGYILWYILFNEEKFVAILANKASTSREILSRVKIAYEALPLWLQQGVRTWNKGDIELENKCRVMATSTASSAIRGFSISLLYLDEFAFVPSNIADEFFTSVYPTISSGTTSKILISSTPNGMNHYYKMWTEAVEGLNGFTTIEANWRQVPGRTQQWADDQRSVLGEQKFLQEMECVAGDTVVTVKNKLTSEIKNIEIKQIYNGVTVLLMLEIKQNKNLQVLTPFGWSDFKSVKKKTVNQTLIITFDDQSQIQCTENHLIKIDDKFIEAEWIAIGQRINSKIVTGVDYCYDQIEVYDLVDVELNNEYYTNGVISHNCEFMGSSGTLISGAALKALAFVKPIHASDNGIKIYEQPIKEHSYAMVSDTSRGKGLDYHATTVLDITEIPYKLVATFRDNEMSPLVYPTIIKKLGEYYNQAYALIEINDNGQQVADSLFEDYDYENILSTSEAAKKMTVNWGLGKKSQRGIRTTKSVKRLGCSILKNLIESQKLLIQDFDVIAELSTFISNGSSFEAEEGSHDDLVMCLVLFSWLTNQQFFSDMSNVNMKEKLYREQMQQIEDEQLPTFIAGHDEIDQGINGYVEGGVFWNVVDKNS